MVARRPHRLRAESLLRTRPKLQQIVMQMVPNLNSNFVTLGRGRSTSVRSRRKRRAGRASPVHSSAALSGKCDGLSLSAHPDCADERRHVRRAIAYALDAGALANAWRHEYPMGGSFLPPPIELESSGGCARTARSTRGGSRTGRGRVGAARWRALETRRTVERPDRCRLGKSDYGAPGNARASAARGDRHGRHAEDGTCARLV